MRPAVPVRVTPPVALIVDGQPLAAAQAEHALRRAGYDVIHTAGLASARDILQHRRVDLLIAGLRMARRRRIETRLVVSRRPALDLPAIFLATTAAMAGRAGWQGVTGYLYKPLGAEQVVGAVRAPAARR